MYLIHGCHVGIVNLLFVVVRNCIYSKVLENTTDQKSINQKEITMIFINLQKAKKGEFWIIHWIM